MRDTRLYNLLTQGKMIDQTTYEIDLDYGFDEMLITWNGVLERSDEIEIYFELFSKGIWSQTYKLLRFTRGKRRGGYGLQADAFGSLDIDVFKANKGMEIGKIRVHILSESETESSGCVLASGVFVSLLKEGQVKESQEGISCFMPAPVLVQYPVDKIGRRICSPTSCAMAMNIFGKIVLPVDFAALAYDFQNDIYGNWPMNMAAVSQYGLRAVVRHFMGIDDLVNSIKKGHAVVVSVKTGKDKGFTGALQTYPNGHLMLVRGFEKINGVWCVMVCDPADFDARNSKRDYPVEELLEFWSGVGYEIGPVKTSKRDEGDQVFDSIKKWMPGISLDLRYGTDNNIFGSPVYTESLDRFQMLRIGTLKKLTYAHWLLSRKGYGLKIWDAYRPLAIQQKLWEIHPDERFVAFPEKGSKHNRGCAVDCTLIDASGKSVFMPSDFDDFSERGRADRNDLSPDVKTNIDVLQWAFRKAGFETLEDEWWHFHDSDWKNYDIL